MAGPGSFFTSVMPNLLVHGVTDAICASAAPRIYLCNVATQAGETDAYSVIDHMRKLRELAGEAFTTVLANDNIDGSRRPSEHSDWVQLPNDRRHLGLSHLYGRRDRRAPPLAP